MLGIGSAGIGSAGIGSAGLAGGGGGGGGGGFTLTVGVSGSTQAGYNMGSFGTLVPDTLEGITIDRLVAIDTGSSVTSRTDLAMVGDVQVGSATVFDVTIEGAPANPYTLTWNGSTRYTASGAVHQALETYLDGQEGNDLAVTITDVTP